MTNLSTSQPSRAWRWLWAAGAVLLVVGSGAWTWRFTRPGAPFGAAPATAPAEPAGLVKDHDYYLHVKLIEVTPRMTGDKPWDRADDSGPDLKFSLTWRKNVIWKSIEKPNTLIGSWDLMKFDVRQMIMSGSQDLEGLVNAPLIHYTPGESVELKVWDEDTVGSDEAGSIRINLDDLRLGENTLTPTGGAAKALKRVSLTVIDRRTPLPDLATMISNR